MLSVTIQLKILDRLTSQVTTIICRKNILLKKNTKIRRD